MKLLLTSLFKQSCYYIAFQLLNVANSRGVFFVDDGFLRWGGFSDLTNLKSLQRDNLLQITATSGNAHLFQVWDESAQIFLTLSTL